MLPRRWLLAALMLPLLPAAGAADHSDQDALTSEMSFFVSSVGIDDGSANLGGLAGADRHCQNLAQSVGAGDKTWRAYLSASAEAGHSRVDARDRIGTGPWKNAQGVLIARTVDELHSDNNRLDRHTALTEKGEVITGRQHDMLTGSNADGRLAIVYGVAATCDNWRSDGDGTAMMGHHDRYYDSGPRFPRWKRSWNAAHPSRGCDPERVRRTGSSGLFYCFASQSSGPTVPADVNAEAQDPTRYTFKRGVNIAHWLSRNMLPRYPYAGDWFDEEDVAWIAAQGFDHLRVRVGGEHWIDAQGDIDQAKIAHFDNVLRWAGRHRLGVVLTMYSLPGFRAENASARQAVTAASPFTDEESLYDAEYLWWQVARRYANQGHGLRFELLHKPDAETAAQMEKYNSTMLAAIRSSNPTRVVYLGVRAMSLDNIDEVVSDDPNAAIVVEFWEPRAFTFQFDSSRPLVKFPSSASEQGAEPPQGEPTAIAAEAGLTVAEIDRRVEKLAEWARGRFWGREVYVGEFGVQERADDDSARRYIGAVRTALERQDLSWAVYDYQSGCAVRDQDGRPTRILEGLALTKTVQP